MLTKATASGLSVTIGPNQHVVARSDEVTPKQSPNLQWKRLWFSRRLNSAIKYASNVLLEIIFTVDRGDCFVSPLGFLATTDVIV